MSISVASGSDGVVLWILDLLSLGNGGVLPPGRQLYVSFEIRRGTPAPSWPGEPAGGSPSSGLYIIPAVTYPPVDTTARPQLHSGGYKLLPILCLEQELGLKQLGTLMRALGSRPERRSLAISWRICWSLSSRLLRSRLMRDTASFISVLLHTRDRCRAVNPINL
eukprot:SM000076S21787  [mRNA]  locus=s76:185877:187828:+ [translate_table: standard]